MFLLGYALLTGGRPPVLRAAVMVGAFGGAVILRRQPNLANSFALAWLVVAAINPTDLFNPGCQLSFLAVAVLYWGTSRWIAPISRLPFVPLLPLLHGATDNPAIDPLDVLVEKSRPAWQRALRWLVWQVLLLYAINLVIWLAVTPLVASRYHVVSPGALLIGPPVVLLTSAALIAGFLLLLAAAVCWPLVPVFAFLTRWSLAGCEFLVNLGDGLPGSRWYVGDIPEWWLWIFYAGLLGVLLVRPLRQRWRWAVPAGVGWVCVGLLAIIPRPASGELRCTFLAVGHGGCTVLETPDGRTLLYDAGAMAGPDVTRRQIAPFLWHRGIRRVDEVFLSHADLDHFNGLPALLERFRVGQVTCTPTFADKTTPGVRVVLDELERRRVPVRIVRAGDRLSAGEVTIDVLHPPEAGPDGVENVRSLVLLVRHGGHSILLTGDLEKAGLDRVLELSPPKVDILQAPHHGSRTANKPERIMKWARPKVVVSCQGPPPSPVRSPDPFTAGGADFLPTWPHGAVTVRSHASGLVVETYATRQRFVVRVD